jgi:FecR protein
MARSISKLVTKALCLIILFSSGCAYANIGSVTEFKAAGQIKRSSASLPVVKGTGVEKNDTITTNSQGRFKITFVDATTVSITENSKLAIDDFVYSDSKSKGKLGLKVALGTVRYASGAIAHGNPSGVNIRTPTATVGVRGTDFVMSVDEVGRTMVVLLPSCFDDNDPTRDVSKCDVGAIEVITAAGVVRMNVPFQATVVENSFTPPSPPAVVNLTGKQLNNSLQISTPQTTSGVDVVSKARKDTTTKTNPAKASAESNDVLDNADDSIIQMITVATQIRPATSDELSQLYADNNGSPPKETIYTNVSPTYYKKVQVGWVYTKLSDSKQEGVTVYLPKDTGVQLISVQDGIPDSYNFSNQKWTTQGTGKPQGNITIWQNQAPVGH